MIVHVEGIGKLSEGEYNGRPYSHRTIYVSYEDKQFVPAGVCVERFKVSTAVNDLSGVSVGDDLDVSFNRFGRIIDVKEV